MKQVQLQRFNNWWKGLALFLLMILVGRITAFFPEVSLGAVLFIIIVLAISVIGNSIGVKRLWSRLLIILYILLFAFSLNDFGRTELLGQELPLYILLLPLLLLLLFLRALRPDKRTVPHKNLGLNSELILAAFLFGVLLLSSLASRDVSGALYQTFKIQIFMVGYFVLSQLLVGGWEWKNSRWVYLVSIIIVSVIGLYAYFVSPLHWIRLVAEEDRSGNLTGFIAEFSIIILLGTLLTSRDSKKQLASLILVIFILSTLLLTLSRGTWIALFCGSLVLILLSARSINFKGFFMLVAGLALIVLILMSSQVNRARIVLDRLQSVWTWESSSEFRIANSNEKRLLIFKYYLEVIEENPLWGVGADNKFATARLGFNPGQAHNSFLEIWAGFGTIALAILLGFLALHGINLWRVRNSINDAHIWGNVLIATYVAMLVHSLFGNFILGHAFWTILAFQGAAIKIAKDGKGDRQLIGYRPSTIDLNRFS